MDAEDPTHLGWGPLHVAAAEGNDETVTALLELGADPNRTAEKGTTPLHLAKSLLVIKALLDGEADPTVVDDADMSPAELELGGEHATKMLKEAALDWDGANAEDLGETPMAGGGGFLED